MGGNRRTDEAKYLFRQTLAALGPIIITVTAGMTTGYSATLLPQLKPNNSTTSIPTDYLNMKVLTVTGTEEMSWIAAAAALPMAPGCWIAAILMEKFGRRSAFLIMIPFFLLGWVLIGLAPSVLWMIIGRFIIGTCSGVNGPLGPVYIAETSEPRLRGILLSGISLAISVGILIAHILGTWLHWRLTALMCASSAVLGFILTAIAPESPTWLVKNGKSERARKVWHNIRGQYCEHEFETLHPVRESNYIINTKKELESSTKNKTSLATDDHSASSSPSSWRTVITSRGFLAPLLILNVFFFTCQFAGVNAVAFYSVTLLQEVAGPENAYSTTIALDLIRVVFSAIACWLTKSYGRRSLTVISGVGSGVSLLLLSASLYVDFGKPWLPVIFIVAYTCIVYIGLVPLPWLLCGELFAASVRGLGSGLTSGFAFICFFIVVKTAPTMLEDFGPSWTYTFYGTCALSGTIFLYAFLPETKDKTLQEIEERISNPRGRSQKSDALP